MVINQVIMLTTKLGVFFFLFKISLTIDDLTDYMTPCKVAEGVSENMALFK